MENKNTENEKQKLQESFRKLQLKLQKALEEGRYWGMQQKIQTLQRSIHLTQRI